MRWVALSVAALGLVVVLIVASGAIDSDDPTVAQTPTPFPSAEEPPKAPTVMRFAVIGDWGSGLSFQRDIARRMCKWRAKHPYDTVITSGDNIYPNGISKYFRSNFLDPMRCLLNRGVRFHSSLGNHDVQRDNGRDQLRRAEFGMPARNYVLRLNGVRFVIADSNRLNRAWLRRALPAEPTDRWTVVVFHHPVFAPSSGLHVEELDLSDLPKLFVRRDVDLVLNGHEHFYAVTRPLRKIRYVVTGGGGHHVYPCGRARFSRMCRSRHHFLYVVADETRVTVSAVPTRGAPFHTFVSRGRNDS